jgi:uroporphyrin-3 C-methyltransferase
MTEQTPVNDPAVSPASPDVPTSIQAQSTAGSVPGGSPGGRKPARTRSANGVLTTIVILAILLCVALGSALWVQRKQFVSAGREVAQRLDGVSSALNQAKADTREALSLAQAQSAKVSELEGIVREVQSQYRTLEQAWRSFNDTAGDTMLANDIERLLTIANQQLRLAGNVGNAIVALETAQARLARADRPRFASLLQAINGDLDRLRAVNVIDVPAQSARIDRLIALVSSAPLLVPDAAAPGASPANAAAPIRNAPPSADVEVLPADAPWWQVWRARVASWPGQAASMFRYELGDLIRVQRVDQPAAIMLSTEQAEQLRSTLRQRLLTVQLSLLMRQPGIWKSETENVVRAITSYYDGRSPDTMSALALARELSQTEISVPVPDLSNSLNAVAALRAQSANPQGANPQGQD